ncbi:MAG: hypothetical protein H7258_11675 [Ferruginibacter sp.]|nr:hypothetical protein [Ferruginibacter sp.]
MKACFFWLLIVFSSLAEARNYYIDPSATNKDPKGSITDPWKSFESLYKVMAALKPGDSILLKRGELFFEKLNLVCSGRESAPIIVTGYGPGNSKPIFMYKKRGNDAADNQEYAVRIYKSQFIKLEGLEVTDNQTDPLAHNSNALIKIAFSIDESNFVTIQNCDISLVGIGINMVGNNNIVDHCKVNNLRMVRNTNDGGHDDYGANGIVLAGEDNVISKCNFTDCWATSFDFEFGGGAVELAGPVCNGNKIMNNTVINCNGFMKLGSTGAGTINNNFIHKNTVLNCGDILYIDNHGPYTVQVKNLQLISNIFLQTFPQRTRSESMISMTKTSPDKKVIVLQDNIFWLPMKIDVTRSEQFNGEQLFHTNNLYYLGGGNLNFDLHRSEKILDLSSKIFNKISEHAGSRLVDFYPFRFLLKYWYLII